MNDQQIYALMVRTPAIRAVQIADALDVDLRDVSASLRSLVEVGDVVQSKGVSPNGQQAMVYDLSAAFKKSREYGVLVALDAAKPKPAPAPVVVATPVFKTQTVSSKPAPPAAGSSPAALAPILPPIEQATSKVARAIAFIRWQGEATDAQLREAMELPARAAPLSYLASAVRNGRLHRDGSAWRLGVAPPMTSDQAKVALVEEPPVIAQPLEKLEQFSPAPLASTIRCAVWSDGTFELRTGDAAPVTLSAAEFQFVRDYLAKSAA